MVFVVFEIIKSTVVQNDLFACIKVLIRVWCRYVEWVIRPSELNIWGEKEYFSTEWSWCLRVMAIIIVVGVVIAGEMFVLKKIEQYRRVWDKYSMRLMVVSLEMIIVSGDVMRRFMPINLVVLFGIINIQSPAATFCTSGISSYIACNASLLPMLSFTFIPHG